VVRVVATLEPLQNIHGGFGGGPGQLSHLAPTYAAINALCIVGLKAGFDMIDRRKMYSWLVSLKQPDGSFVMHMDGEVDVRGSYCALAVAKLLGILTPELAANTAQFIQKCQTYEGGLGGSPGVEAHGGYTFCGLAAADLVDATSSLNVGKMWQWAVERQMSYEGGFQGRTNKLVDGCYSFWLGGVLPILNRQTKSCMYNRQALQTYLLVCAQAPSGMRDKPDKNPDFYHTCYCLSGLSLAQYDYTDDYQAIPSQIVGPETNRLPPTHPVHNLRPERVAHMIDYFK
jgi:protein farnesyltransferase subunit beta